MSMSMIASIFSVAFTFGLIIFVHELGHFLMAKRTGVKVEKFSLGFGKKVVGFKKGDTEYCISVFPLGGYVKMAGEEEGEGEREGKEWEFLSKSPGQRSKILVAGVAMNFLLACFLMILILFVGLRLPNYSNRIGSIREGSPAEEMGLKAGDKIVAIDEYEVNDWYGLKEVIDKSLDVSGSEVVILREGKRLSLKGAPGREDWGISPYIPAEIGSVIPGLPAYLAGLKAGDRILSLNGKKVNQWSDMAESIQAALDEEIVLEVKRGQTVFSVTVKSELQEAAGKSYRFIGIEVPSPSYRLVRYGFWGSIKGGLRVSLNEMVMTYKGLWMLITRPGKYGKYLGGPVLIAQMVAQESKMGYDRFLSMIAKFNIWLVVLNLLPIPVLDGGHLMFTLVESIRRKPLAIKTQQVLQQIGMTIIIAIMVVAFANDTLRQVGRVKALHRAKEVYSP